MFGLTEEILYTRIHTMMPVIYVIAVVVGMLGIYLALRDWQGEKKIRKPIDNVVHKELYGGGLMVKNEDGSLISLGEACDKLNKKPIGSLGEELK